MKKHDKVVDIANNSLSRKAQNPGSRAESVNDRVASKNMPLIGWLFEEAGRRGIAIRELASELGVTYGYIAQLRNGVRSAKAISEEFSGSCAKFLRVPRVAIMMASGQLSVEDYYSTDDCFESEIDNAIEHIRKDPEWSVWCAPSLRRADYSVKQLVVIAYEHATSKVLLSTRVDVQDVSCCLDEYDF